MLACLLVWLLVVIYDLHLAGVLSAPDEADPVLTVDTDAVLAFPVALESFEIAGHGDRLLQLVCGVSGESCRHTLGRTWEGTPKGERAGRMAGAQARNGMIT